jgi:hypothetical protein
MLILKEGANTISRVMGDYNAADDARNIAEILQKQSSKPE